MPEEDVVQIWQESLEPELIERFKMAKRKYLGDIGQITEGAKVQRYCNSAFGWRLDQNVVSEYGVALVISKFSVPVYIFGVSIKDFPHREPFTLYRLMLQPNKQYDYQTKGFLLYGDHWDDDWDEMLEIIEREFQELRNIIKA